MSVHPDILASRIVVADVIDGLRSLDAGSVHCCVTSPPYWGLRDYGVEGQIGLESTPEEFVAKMVEVFREVRRVLRDDASLWLNLGDSYAGSWGAQSRGDNYASTTLEGLGESYDFSRKIAAAPKGTGTGSMKITPGLKPKDLCMMPWRVAMALQADGWWLRSVICWAKKSPMPESCRDRPTSSWEPIFLLTKNDRYFYDAEAVKEARTGLAPGNVKPVKGAGEDDERFRTREGLHAIEATTTRNMRNVWHLAHDPYPGAHFATFPREIPRKAIKAGTSERGACPDCGAPWERITERRAVTRERPNDFTKRDGEEGTGNSCANSVAGVAVRTVGWYPTCGCDPHGLAPRVDEVDRYDDAGRVTPLFRDAIDTARASPAVPCVVLDPFLGSGTTVAVARELGRHGVGIELSPEYAEQARERIGKAERPQTFRSERDATPAGLFSEGNT